MTIVLTKFDVSNGNLDPNWKITNNTDHDVWICLSPASYDRFLDRDGKTLMFRRRWLLPLEEGIGIPWEFPFPKSTYVRLRPAQEKAESLSMPLPVTPNPAFGQSLHANAPYAGRLVLEIGFFNEDLRDLILRTVELAEILHKSDPTLPPGYVWDSDLVERFFGGWSILRNFDGVFRDSVTSGGDRIVLPYLLALSPGELVLRIEVDNVSIPYQSNYPPLADQAGKGEKGPQSKKTDSTELAKAASKKPLERDDSGTRK